MPLHSTHFTPACIAFIKQWQGLSLEKYQDKKGDLGHWLRARNHRR